MTTPLAPTPPRVAVVTGGNHGIGAATAVALAAAGVDVLVTYLRFEPEPDAGRPAAYDAARTVGADDVLAATVGLPGHAVAAEIDLRADDAPGAIFDLAERELGPVAILVNNASGWMADSFVPAEAGEPFPVTPRSVARNLDVDARAGGLMIAELARRHVARGATWGRIVGLTSGSPFGFPNEVSYGAAKAALENYTLSAATELARFGITANVVHPPITDTGWVTDGVRAFVEQSAEHHHVVGPDEVGAVIAWLCSDAAWLVSGNVLRLR